SSFHRTSSEVSDRFLQLLGGAEGNLLARLDLDRFAGRGIAAHARRTLANLKHTEADEANAITLLQMLGDEVDEITEDGFGLLLRHFMVLGQRCGEVLEADGVLLGLRCCCCWLSGHCVETPLK